MVTGLASAFLAMRSALISDAAMDRIAEMLRTDDPRNVVINPLLVRRRPAAAVGLDRKGQRPVPAAALAISLGFLISFPVRRAVRPSVRAPAMSLGWEAAISHAGAPTMKAQHAMPKTKDRPGGVAADGISLREAVTGWRPARRGDRSGSFDFGGWHRRKALGAGLGQNVPPGCRGNAAPRRDRPDAVWCQQKCRNKNHRRMGAGRAGVADRVDEAELRAAIGGQVLDQKDALSSVIAPSMRALRP